MLTHIYLVSLFHSKETFASSTPWKIKKRRSGICLRKQTVCAPLPTPGLGHVYTRQMKVFNDLHRTFLKLIL